MTSDDLHTLWTVMLRRPAILTSVILCLGVVAVYRRHGRRSAVDLVRGTGLTLGALAGALAVYWRLGRGASPLVAGAIFVALYLGAVALAAWIGARLGRSTGAGRTLAVATVVVVLTAMATSLWFVEFLNACWVGRAVLLDARC